MADFPIPPLPRPQDRGNAQPPRPPDGRMYTETEVLSMVDAHEEILAQQLANGQKVESPYRPQRRYPYNNGLPPCQRPQPASVPPTRDGSDFPAAAPEEAHNPYRRQGEGSLVQRPSTCRPEPATYPQNHVPPLTYPYEHRSATIPPPQACVPRLAPAYLNYRPPTIPPPQAYPPSIVQAAPGQACRPPRAWANLVYRPPTPPPSRAYTIPMVRPQPHPQAYLPQQAAAHEVRMYRPPPPSAYSLQTYGPPPGQINAGMPPYPMAGQMCGHSPPAAALEWTSSGRMAMPSTTWVTATTNPPAETALTTAASAPVGAIAPTVPTSTSPPGTKPKKLRGFSAKGENWEVYKTHLEIVRKMNNWNDATTLGNFCSELSDSALEFYSSLDAEERDDYTRVMTAMAQRFGTMVDQEAVRSRLEGMRQKPNQTLEDLATQVRQLAYAVYVNDTQERRENEAIRCFMRAVRPEDIVQALIQASPISSMAVALRIAVRAREMGSAFLNKAKSARMLQGNEGSPPNGDSEPESWPSTMDELAHLNYTSSSTEGEATVAQTIAANRWPEDRTPVPAWAVEQLREVTKQLRVSLQEQGVIPKTSGGGATGAPSNQKIRAPCWLCGATNHWASTCVYRPQHWPDWMKEVVQAVANGENPPSPYVTKEGAKPDGGTIGKAPPPGPKPPYGTGQGGKPKQRPWGQPKRDGRPWQGTPKTTVKQADQKAAVISSTTDNSGPELQENC